jgi:hypothetical protein
VLDELEQRAAAVSREGRSLESWHPVAPGNALPPELAERAGAVLAAQSRAIADLRTQEQQIRTQLCSLGMPAQASSSDVPVYVDTLG